MPTKDQLRSIEWEGANELGEKACPSCYWVKRPADWPHPHHAPDCWLARELATPDTPPPVEVGEIGWLIERPHREGSAVCTYWSGFSDGAWTRKPELAVRFARQEDAERVRAGILGSPDRSRSAEHMWQRGKE